jgi:hypothetical protein
MSVPYFGDFAEDETVYIPFNTFDSNDPTASATITNLVDADIKVHKDGSATEIVTDGATVTIDFDSITGNHLITIDTSVHADYSTGSDYLVRIEGTTVDAGTINAWVGIFSIENRFNQTVVPATVGANMNLADNAITGAKYDESTAFPIKSADTGSTQIARTGADADTLETISDQIDAVPTAAENVNEWETQSQADPTGFHVNVMEVEGVDATTQLETSVTNGINTVLPGTPTAGSLGDYVKRIKFSTVNKMEVDEDDGDCRIYDDSGTLFNTTVAAFTSLAGITKREKVL